MPGQLIKSSHRKVQVLPARWYRLHSHREYFTINVHSNLLLPNCTPLACIVRREYCATIIKVIMDLRSNTVQDGWSKDFYRNTMNTEGWKRSWDIRSASIDHLRLDRRLRPTPSLPPPRLVILFGKSISRKPTSQPRTRLVSREGIATMRTRIPH